MELKRYWTRRKWTTLVALVLGAATLVAGAALLAGVARLVDWLFSTWSVVGTAERLQILSFAVNALLTTILVGATCLYAWLTWRMVRELRESRQLGMRPALVVDLGHLEVGPGHDDAHMGFACECRVVNVGSGPAILPSGEVTMPYRAPCADGDAWLVQGIRTSLPGLPQVLQVGSEASGAVKIDTTSYEIPEGRTLEFVSIELKFQDAERNLFQQTYTFNVVRHGARCYLSVAYERLKMTALRKRWIGDEDVGSGLFPDPAEIIYERAGIL